MGAFLAFGLNHEASVYRSHLEGSDWSEAQLLQHMEQDLGFPADNYAFTPTADTLVWRLRTDELEAQLIPLLEQIYPLLYSSPYYDSAMYESGFRCVSPGAFPSGVCHLSH